MKKNKIITTLFGGILAMSLLSAYTTTEQQPRFKNLKVLPQDISRDSLHNLMEGYNLALGVKCGYCHAKDSLTGKMNFASDDKKEKGFARHMITMTRAINAKDFNWSHSNKPDTINVVTCAMCHRGATEPTKTLAEFAPKDKD